MSVVDQAKKLAKSILFEQIPDKGKFLYGKILDTEEKIDIVVKELISKVEQVSKLEGPKGDSIKGDPGEPGKDYILTDTDKQEIASKIEVPTVEKIIEKTEVVHEQPIITTTNEIKEIAVADTPEVTAEKLNTLKEVIDSTVIRGLLTIDDIKGKLDISDIKNGVWNQPAKGKLDQRWHGGGLSKISHDSSFGGSGTTDDPLTFNGSTEDWKVKVTSADTTAGYLNDKLVAGTGITITKENTGANEDILITNTLDLSSLILIIHKDGTQIRIPQTTDTDVARGTLLLSTITSAISGDTIYLSANTFDLGTDVLKLFYGGRTDISIIGSGKYKTIITSSAVSSDTPVIRPCTNSVVSDLTVTSINGSGYGSNMSDAVACYNATIKDCNVVGTFDGIYFNQIDIDCTVDVINTKVYDNYDAIYFRGSTTSVMNVYDSELIADALSSGDTVDAITCRKGKVNSYNTKHTAINSLVLSCGIYAKTAGVVNVYNGSFVTSGAGSVYDLDKESGGTISVDAGSNYSPTKVKGTIVYLDANTILTAIETVDGTGSGLDADLLDGNHASAFLTTASTLDATKLSGALPALDGTSLTGVLHSEADTLATVTARGATTSVASTFTGGIIEGKNGNSILLNQCFN